MVRTSVAYDPAATYAVQTRDVEYRRADGEAWLARIYQPQGAGPFPAMLDIHGGAWNNGDRLNNAESDQVIAASGAVVVALDFRDGTAHPYPSSLQDINYATRWLKAHAADFNADPETVGGLGTSSGGHLIMLSAMRPRDPRYAALPLEGASGATADLAYVITCWGVLDPIGRYEMARERGLQNYITNHDNYFGTVETQKEASCVLLLERGEKVELPPALVIQGTADEGVPKGMAEKFVSLYRAAGGNAELTWFKDMPHGIAGWSEPEKANMRTRIKGFIAERLAAVTV